MQRNKTSHRFKAQLLAQKSKSGSGARRGHRSQTIWKGRPFLCSRAGTVCPGLRHEVVAGGFSGALVTADDMKAFLDSNGLPKSAKKKGELIDRIVASGLPAIIWDHELEKHNETHSGKTFLSRDESKRIEGAAKVLAEDPYVRAALTGGMPEVSFFVRDPETGIMLKSRMDYVRPRSTVDIKTFSNSRGKPVEKAIFEAIYYEGYHLQCVFYNQVRELARQQLAAGAIRTFGEVSGALVEGIHGSRGTWICAGIHRIGRTVPHAYGAYERSRSGRCGPERLLVVGAYANQ